MKRVGDTTLTFNEFRYLIFDHLDLIDLIKLRQTCKTFVKFSYLKRLIRTKEISAFNGIKQKFWNKLTMVKTPEYWKTIYFNNKYKSKYVLAQLYRYEVKKGHKKYHLGKRSAVRYKMGVYSSKDQIIRAIMKEGLRKSHRYTGVTLNEIKNF